MIALLMLLAGCRTVSSEGECNLENFTAFALEVANENVSKDHWRLAAWEHRAQYDVLCFDKEKLSYCAKTYQFTGGAHGSSARIVGTINRTTGRKYKLAEVVPPKDHEELLRLIREAVATQCYGKKSYAELRKEAVLLEEPFLTENFWFDDKELHFIYNQYEVGCYADGIIEVTVPNRWRK